MKTSLEEISPVKKKLLVEIEADEVNKKVNEAYRELGKRAKIPGFRPGKVPRKILESYFGDQVMDDVTRNLVRDSLADAVEQTKTIPISTPLVENEALKIGQNFKYSAVMEVKPDFDLGNYMGLEVKEEICSVTDEDVDRELEEIRKTNGKLTTIREDRAIKEDDYAVVEYEGFEGDKPLEGIKSKDRLVRVGSGDFHPDLEENLIGVKRDQVTEIDVDFEDQFPHPILAGKKVHFKVKVVDIKELELPVVNDEFAQKLGPDFASLDDLKKRIREELVRREEKRIDRDRKMRLLKQISDPLHFQLPESLVESEIKYAIENIKQNLRRAGSGMEKVGLNQEKLREELRLGAEKRVKDILVLGEIARENNLTISEPELVQGFKEMASSMGQDPEVLRRYYEANDLVDSLRQKLLEEKTLNYLVKGAKVLKVKADEIRRETEENQPNSPDAAPRNPS